jgi:CBS domain-containing protein
VTAGVDDHLAGAACLGRHHGAATLAVVDGDRPIRSRGLITHADTTRAAADGRDLRKVRIEQLMSQSPHRGQHR